MSHHYEAKLVRNYNIECSGIVSECDAIVISIEKMCKDLRKNSSSVLDKEMISILDEIESTCQTEKNELSAIHNELSKFIGIDTYNETVNRLKNINELQLKASSIQDIASKTARDFSNVYEVHSGINEFLKSISDMKLRAMIRGLSLNPKHDDLSLEELKELAESKLDPSKKVSQKLCKETIKLAKRKMEESNIPKEIIDKSLGDNMPRSPLEIMNEASKQIIDENLRKKAIKAIISNITEKGFIVKKENIRINRENNIVTMTADKPGGQRAEFQISLDGKFVYKFDNYEGHACEKDIEPFENDLELLYGIKITDKKEIWSNPDREANMYHAQMKVRRGT